MHGLGDLSILNLKTFYLEMVKKFVLHGLGSLSISDFGNNFKTLQGMGLRTLAGMGVKNLIPQNRGKSYYLNRIPEIIGS